MPAEKDSPAPVRTTTSQRLSTSRESKTPTISRAISMLMAFFFSGRFIATQAMPASNVTATVFFALIGRGAMIFKIATEPQEFERIHALNFKTFVEEIPQHPRNAAARLIDRRHAANTYIICLDGETLAGMVALSAARPFSLDEKLADLDAYLPGGRKLCEIRLLSVAPAYRKTPVFLGLIARLSDVAIARGYDLAVISGTTRELKLYRHLGFTPFGPLVGSAGAKYQPMMLTLERFEGSMLRLIGERSGAVSFLPGPVEVTQEVRAAFCSRPLSHRSETFLQSMASVRQQLLSLTGARGVVVLLGSGTLANDAVAAQLSTICGKGLNLANG